MSKTGTPPGWDFNPSAWRRRIPLLIGAAAGSAISFTLHPHDSGARDLFLLFFVSSLISECLGGSRRWRTTPWAVVLTAGLVLPALFAVGISIYESASPASAGTSKEELFLSAIAVFMIGPIAGELLASLQFLRRLSRQGRSTWRALWGLDPKRRLKNHWNGTRSSTMEF